MVHTTNRGGGGGGGGARAKQQLIIKKLQLFVFRFRPPSKRVNKNFYHFQGLSVQLSFCTQLRRGFDFVVCTTQNYHFLSSPLSEKCYIHKYNAQNTRFNSFFPISGKAEEPNVVSESVICNLRNISTNALFPSLTHSSCTHVRHTPGLVYLPFT